MERLEVFSVKDMPHEDELRSHLLFHKADLYKVEKLLDIRMTNGLEEVLVKWLGFEDEEATWEPAVIIEEDLPHLVRQIRKSHPGEILA